MAWPKRSLIDLKLSRSSSITAVGRGSVTCRLKLLFAVLQERAAIGDAGQRIDHGRGLVAMLGALLRHRQEDEGDRDGEQQRLEAEHREPHAFEQLVVARQPRQHGAERRAQQIKRAVREQHEDRRPARNQRLAAAAPEFERRGPGVGGDDAGRQQHAQVEGIGEAGNPAGDEPQRGAGEQQHGLRLAMIEQPRARPRQRERGEENGVGEIDGDQFGDRAVEPEQRHRGGAQQMREAPPRHGGDGGVLRPGKQQQQSEDRFHIDGDEKQGIDVEIHRDLAE